MKTITVEELKQRKDAGEELTLLDVREPAEIEEFNIGGVALPLGKIQRMETESIEYLKDKEVICYCRSGKRSMMAMMVLEQLGFENVKNLEGGVDEYRKKYGEEF